MASLTKRPRSQYWTACFTGADGRRLKRSTKESNRQKAQKIADEFEQAARSERTATQTREVIADLHEQITGESLPNTSLRQYLEEWLESKLPTVGHSAQLLYRRSADRLADFLGGRANEPMTSITREDLVRFRNAEGERVSASTANNLLKCAKRIFRDAYRDRLIVENPGEFVEPLRARVADRDQQRRPFTTGELQHLLKVANPEWTSMILFGLYTGQRLGDISRLLWRDVDIAKGMITFHISKTDRIHRTGIAEPLREFLEGRAGDLDMPVHPEAHRIVNKQDGRTGTLSRQFGEILQAAGLREKRTRSHHKDKDKNGRDGKRTMQPLTFHSLRRTTTTMLHEAGVPAAIAQEIIGHNSKEVHDIYISIGKSAVDDALGKLPEIRS